MVKSYKTSGVCAREIKFDIDNGVIKSVEFIGGCDGNRKAVAALVKGKNVNDVIDLLSGITCEYRGTSCADQLARALESDK